MNQLEKLNRKLLFDLANLNFSTAAGSSSSKKSSGNTFSFSDWFMLKLNLKPPLFSLSQVVLELLDVWGSKCLFKNIDFSQPFGLARTFESEIF